MAVFIVVGGRTLVCCGGGGTIPLMKFWRPASGLAEGGGWVTNGGAVGKKVKRQTGGSERECKGSLCGWDGSTCRVKVNDKLDKNNVFNRLLSTLISNAKLRGVVLDGRNTPFFSTILYLQLPHELIITDMELDKLIA